MNPPSLDERIEGLRRRLPRERRPSIGDLAARAQISRSRWYRIMSGGAEFTLAEAQRLASILDVEVGALTGRAIDEREPEVGPEKSGFNDLVRRVLDALSGALDANALSTPSVIAGLRWLEEAALLEGQRLPNEYWSFRRHAHEYSITPTGQHAPARD